MASKFGWIDFSEKERRQMLDVVQYEWISPTYQEPTMVKSVIGVSMKRDLSCN